MSRRTVVGAVGLACVAPRAWAGGDYQGFLTGLRAEAEERGISRSVIASSLALAAPNARVLSLNSRQPEFTLTWDEYEARVLPPARISQARSVFAAHDALFGRVRETFSVDPGVIVGIWGLESDFGRKQGDFGVFDSLATLAYASHRHRFFRDELLDALTIADQRGVPPGDMLGSWAGAMGQPQFMPSAYLRFACGLDGSPRANIWTSETDVVSSVANYLGKSGWHLGEPWVQRVRVPTGFNVPHGGAERRSLAEWERVGVRRLDGSSFSRGDVLGRLLLPDGSSGAAFMVYRNFDVIRRYNPSDFYALAVGLLGNQIA